jgi:hypothetical protein
MNSQRAGRAPVGASICCAGPQPVEKTLMTVTQAAPSAAIFPMKSRRPILSLMAGHLAELTFPSACSAP